MNAKLKKGFCLGFLTIFNKNKHCYLNEEKVNFSMVLCTRCKQTTKKEDLRDMKIEGHFIQIDFNMTPCCQ